MDHLARRSLRIGRGAPFVTIGERINPTGRKVFSQAIREGRTDLIVQDARAQVEGGAMALDVNVGVPLVDEAAMLERAVHRGAERRRTCRSSSTRRTCTRSSEASAPSRAGRS